MRYTHQLLITIILAIVPSFIFCMEEPSKSLSQPSDTITVLAALQHHDIQGQTEDMLIKIIQQLLNSGANINAQNSQGVTALLWATGKNYTKLVKFLLDNNADANRASIPGTTPLMWAASHNYVAIVQLLLEHNTNINACDQKKRTALHCSTTQNDPDMTALLLNHGSDVDAQDIKGDTALHIAARHGHRKIITLLCNRRANSAIKNTEGLTPQNYADKRQCKLYLSTFEPALGIIAGALSSKGSENTPKAERPHPPTSNPQPPVKPLASQPTPHASQKDNHAVTKPRFKTATAATASIAALITTACLGYYWHTRLPENVSAQELYSLLIEAIAHQNYKHACRLVKHNSEKTNYLLDSQKNHLQELIAQSEQVLAEKAAHDAASFNFATRFFSTIKTDLELLKDLLFVVKNP